MTADMIKDGEISNEVKNRLEELVDGTLALASKLN